VSGGSTSVPDMSLALQMLATVINSSLRLANRRPVAWALVMQIDNTAQYVSNTSREDGLALVEDMLERWRADAAADLNSAPTAPDIDERDTMGRYGTRFGLSDTALAEVAAQRGQEIERLRLVLIGVERERDEALGRARTLEAAWNEHLTALAAGLTPRVKPE
jgi:hypothetical protein